jgi:hypothetical protein
MLPQKMQMFGGTSSGEVSSIIDLDCVCGEITEPTPYRDCPYCFWNRWYCNLCGEFTSGPWQVKTKRRCKKTRPCCAEHIKNRRSLCACGKSPRELPELFPTQCDHCFDLRAYKAVPGLFCRRCGEMFNPHTSCDFAICSICIYSSTFQALLKVQIGDIASITISYFGERPCFIPCRDADCCSQVAIEANRDLAAKGI